jgi:nicotinate-nucleotide adenylyltransferase
VDKIGVLGGTFDPVHIGHLMLAEHAAEAFNLARVLFLPSGLPPHKDAGKITSAAHRAEMVRLAICGNDNFEVSNAECDNPGVSYTYSTLETLRLLYGESSELYYIIGADVLNYITKFRNYRRVFNSCTLIASTRPGDDHKRTEALAGKLAEAYNARIELLKFPEIAISSSYIRARIAGGGDVRYMLPDPVIEYIIRNGLYRTVEETALPGYWESIPEPEPEIEREPVLETDRMPEFAQFRSKTMGNARVEEKDKCEITGNELIDVIRIKNIAKSMLSPDRFKHTLGVMETAVALAARFGADQYEAAAAGLLHDCMREAPVEELLAICESGGIMIDARDLKTAAILHAPAGSIMAKRILGTAGIDISEAIAGHTTGRAGMGLLAKILFAADAVEPGRDYDTALIARSMLGGAGGDENDLRKLDATVLFLLEKQMEHIAATGRALHQDTVLARDWMVQYIFK